MPTQQPRQPPQPGYRWHLSRKRNATALLIGIEFVILGILWLFGTIVFDIRTLVAVTLITIGVYLLAWFAEGGEWQWKLK